MKKILSAHHRVCIELIENGLLPEIYLNKNFVDIFKLYKSCFNSSKFLVDRSGKTPHYLNVNLEKYKIPNIPNFSKSFEQVSIDRVKQLLSLDKVINVSWSGGIDSTFTLCMFYNLCEDKSRIKVYGTYNSIIESGTLFEKFIRPNFKFDIHTNTSYKNNYNCSDNEIFVTGSMGNNIFYQDLNYWNPDSWMTFKTRAEDPIKAYANDYYKDVLAEETVEFLQNSIDDSPRKIETLQDLRWWIQFAFNWHTTKSNSYIQLPKERCEKIHAFFDSDEFQMWSITTNDPPTKTGDYSDERWQMREIIEEITGDRLYSKNKKNCTSVLSPFEPNWLFLMDDYSNVTIV